jgi:hypothetical protein
MTHAETTYRLIDGPGLLLQHFDETVRLAPGEPVSLGNPEELAQAA